MHWHGWNQKDTSATEAVLRSEKKGQVQAIDLDKEGFLGPEDSGTLEEELDTINMMLYVKDRFNVSGGAYTTRWRSCVEICHVTTSLKIEGTSGVQQSIEERLHYCLEHLVCIILNTILCVHLAELV